MMKKASEKRTPAQLREVLRKAWEEFEEQGGIPHDRFWEGLAKSRTDMEAGRIKPALEALDELAKKHKLKGKVK